MKSWVITRYGNPEQAFELKDGPDPAAGPEEVILNVEAFGINFADLSARAGSYKDAPKIPFAPGYEVVGRVEAIGSNIKTLSVGDRVAAFTRFGGYATKVAVNEQVAVVIPEDMPAGEALALCVQYVTAWFCIEDRLTVMPGDHVLVQAAAGGVGTAMVQLLRHKGCTIYGTAGSEAKIKYLREQGVHHPINYREEDFADVIPKIDGYDGLDIVFDSLGGKAFKQGFKLLRPGGRIVGFGASSRQGKSNFVFNDIRLLLGFGFHSPPFLLMGSRSVIGVNMLRIADHRPDVLRHCLIAVLELWKEGKINPVVDKEFKGNDLKEAHDYVGARKSKGKVVVVWD